MNENSDLDKKQSDFLNYIAVRNVVEENIVDLQSIMPSKSRSFKESERITDHPSWEDNEKDYSLSLQNPQEKNGNYQNKVIQRESEQEETDPNFEVNSIQNIPEPELQVSSAPPVIISKYFLANVPFFSRRRRRFEKQMPPGDAKFDVFRKLNNNNQSHILKPSDDVVEQNNEFDGLSHRSSNKVRHKWNAKLPRNSFNVHKNLALFNRPMDPFSDIVMLNLRNSHGLIKSFKGSSKIKNDNKKKSKKSNIIHKRKEKQAVFTGKGSNGTTFKEQTVTTEKISKAANTTFEEQPLTTDKLPNAVNTTFFIGQEIFNSSDLLNSTTARPVENTSTINRRFSDIEPSLNNRKGVLEGKNNRHLPESESTTKKEFSITLFKTKNPSFFSTETNIHTEQRGVRENAFSTHLQEADEVNLFQLNSTILPPFYRNFSENETSGTTDDIIQIDLFNKFLQHVEPSRQKKTVPEDEERVYKIFHDWKKADLILTGVAGITALVLVVSCIAYGQRRQRKNYSLQIKDSEEKGNFLGWRKSAKITGTFFRLMMRKRKTGPKKKRHPSQDRIFAGKSSEEKFNKDGYHSQKCFSSKNTLTKHLIITDSLKMVDSTSRKEIYQINEEKSEILRKDSVYHRENRDLSSARIPITYYRSNNNDRKTTKIEKLTKPIQRYSLPEPLDEKYISSGSEVEITDAAVQTSFEDHNIPQINSIKSTRLPSLPSISSENSPCSSSERTDT
ncbi:uncharacterized protein TNCT_316921 [Trichonephila clavata]|uniref:Uncharacterized protein n=1 Tax=Trichonephila clavata TaxID=2740835 RepID=A0A8X6KG66_TRICU|nr:uncharacterized protein TNCT_316921 [Trichonephila clavata]